MSLPITKEEIVLREVTTIEMIYQEKCFISGQTIFYSDLGGMTIFTERSLSDILSIFKQRRREQSK